MQEAPKSSTYRASSLAALGLQNLPLLSTLGKASFLFNDGEAGCFKASAMAKEGVRRSERLGGERKM